jgi:hypothetical protein
MQLLLYAKVYLGPVNVTGWSSRSASQERGRDAASDWLEIEIAMLELWWFMVHECQERKETDGKAELDMEDKKVIRSVGNSTSEWNEFPLHSYIVDTSWQWRDVCDILMHCLVICIRQVAPKQFLYLTMLMTIEVNPLRKSSTTWSLPYSLRYCYDIYDLLQGVLRRHYFTGILAVLAHQEISWTIQEIS